MHFAEKLRAFPRLYCIALYVYCHLNYYVKQSLQQFDIARVAAPNTKTVINEQVTTRSLFARRFQSSVINWYNTRVV